MSLRVSAEGAAREHTGEGSLPRHGGLRPGKGHTPSHAHLGVLVPPDPMLGQHQVTG